LAHPFHAAHSRILAALKAIYRVGAYARLLRQLLGTPTEGSAGHTALNRLHVVTLTPHAVDFKPVTVLPLAV
jgi:hypothetical protein